MKCNDFKLGPPFYAKKQLNLLNLTVLVGSRHPLIGGMNGTILVGFVCLILNFVDAKLKRALKYVSWHISGLEKEAYEVFGK